MDRDPSNSSPFSGLRTDTPGRVQYQTPTAVLTSKLDEGTDFIVIARGKQSEDPLIWSTGDQAQTEELYRRAAAVMVDAPQPVT